MARSLTERPDREPDDIPDYPMPRAEGCPLDPPPDLAAMRAEGPLVRVRLWDGSTPWLVTRHAEQRALLTDRRLSTNPRADGYPHLTPATYMHREQPFSFMFMDDPEHAQQRRMVTEAFSVKRIERMRPGVQSLVDDLIDELLAGPSPVDLVTAFALPLTSLVICRLLGVPYTDHDYFQRASGTLITHDTPPEVAGKTQEELLMYLDRLVERKLAEPGDDLLSRVAAEHVATGRLSRPDLAFMGLLLLIAGHATTANMIALGTYALLTHPEQLTEVRATDDPNSIARTVEEMLRYLSPVHNGVRRVAMEDIEIAGTVIRAGEGIIVPNEVANRDETVFPNADRLDVHRDARGHMAFGFGVHQCLGRPLARLELQVVYGTLYRRIPTLALAIDPARIKFRHDTLVYGIYELPVTW
ncbi:cytochrome P450 [Actinoallomurus soli]|uniref:cytochrome P450 n=1 Tax=Actinoallomurus soli TaxID=2952535 RepID=UPI002092E8A9|nr:cytochrome P450 [Actinoallomurus soli]MCO5974048.1 cytochrome P450 [Actinoallomurus soli]